MQSDRNLICVYNFKSSMRKTLSELDLICCCLSLKRLTNKLEISDADRYSCRLLCGNAGPRRCYADIMQMLHNGQRSEVNGVVTD